MNSNETKTLEALDRAIEDLNKAKQALIDKMPILSRLKKNDWVIDKRTNSHSQFVDIKHGIINLVRYSGTRTLAPDVLNENFTIATPEQIEKHLRFLNSKGLWYVDKKVVILDYSGELAKSIPATSHYPKSKIDVPEFYLITVKGEQGAKVRHESFDVAVREAKRLAKKTNHRAHIMGVVGIIEPVQVVEPITEYQLITKR